jgi:hypothetical protein
MRYVVPFTSSLHLSVSNTSAEKFIGPHMGVLIPMLVAVVLLCPLVVIIVSAHTNYSFIHCTCGVLNFTTRLNDRRMT